jgi:Flp pilus assembly protein TadD
MESKKIWLGALMALVLLAGCARNGLRERERLLTLEDQTRKQVDVDAARFKALSGQYIAMISGPPGDKPATKAQIDAKLAAMRQLQEQILKTLGQFEDSTRAYLAQHPDDIVMLDRLGHFYADEQQSDEAEAVWREVIRRAPEYSSAYNNIGTLYTHMGRDMEAVDLFRRAIEINPNEPEYYDNLATMYAVHRDEVAKKFGWDLPRAFDEMMAAYGKARELAPEDTDYAREYADAFQTAGYYGVTDVTEQAIAAWEHYLALKLTPAQRAFGLNRLAQMLLRKGDAAGKTRAAELLRESLSIQDTPMAREILKEINNSD